MEFGLRPLGRERFWLWALLTPTFIGLLFGAFGSILATLLLSFAKWDLLTPPVWAGTINYVNLLTRAGWGEPRGIGPLAEIAAASGTPSATITSTGAATAGSTAAFQEDRTT